MTEAEQRLLTAIARTVIRIAKSLGQDHTVVETQLHAMVHDDAFLDAVMALEDAGMDQDLQHTGGGIYVLYHRLNDDPAGPCVGITPDELHPGFWTLVSYRDNQDEGLEVRHEVSLAGLVDAVTEMAESLEYWLGIEYRIPGTFSAIIFADGGVKFTFLPAAADAGYFGPAMFDDDQSLTLEEANPVFDQIGEVLGNDGRFMAYWES